MSRHFSRSPLLLFQSSPVPVLSLGNKTFLRGHHVDKPSAHRLAQPAWDHSFCQTSKTPEGRSAIHVFLFLFLYSNPPNLFFGLNRCTISCTIFFFKKKKKFEPSRQVPLGSLFLIFLIFLIFTDLFSFFF